ncbi:MAG: cyclic pyranopterin monophosphate synthase MoaC [Pseudomonadales bacterium]|nr:cyclic pyranopterin monophosphate synthase MoaC [Pseudomonadales bacterium]
MPELTHLNARGEASMVDVSDKSETTRVAVASVFVEMSSETMEKIYGGSVEKGDVLAVARVAGIQGAKRCSDLIPLCHPLALSRVSVDFDKISDRVMQIRVEAKVSGKTGVEMEALTGASIAALTIYDMCKAVDREMCINELKLLSKVGGKSGDWQRSGEEIV